MRRYPRTCLVTRNGFTLTELAVVLLIIALLIGGLLVPLSAQVDLRNASDTSKSLADAREALLGFATANGRLPCPANPTIASGAAGAGTEDCTRTIGALPWAALSLSQLDAWGRRFTYRVTDSFKDGIAAATVAPPVTCIATPAQSSFALCSEGDITVTDGSTLIASKIPAIVVSHGSNGRGAFLPDGTQIPGAANDEFENANNNATFVSRTSTSPGSANEFDDLVAWVPLAILMNRMVTAGKLP